MGRISKTGIGKKETMQMIIECSLEDLKEFKEALVIGKTYKIMERINTDYNQGREKIKKIRKIRLVEKYPHIATFEDEYGQKTSWDYWAIQKLLKGEMFL